MYGLNDSNGLGRPHWEVALFVVSSLRNPFQNSVAERVIKFQFAEVNVADVTAARFLSAKSRAQSVAPMAS